MLFTSCFIPVCVYVLLSYVLNCYEFWTTGAFQRIAEAYEILSDSDKRRAYDEGGDIKVQYSIVVIINKVYKIPLYHCLNYITY